MQPKASYTKMPMKLRYHMKNTEENSDKNSVSEAEFSIELGKYIHESLASSSYYIREKEQSANRSQICCCFLDLVQGDALQKERTKKTKNHKFGFSVSFDTYFHARK